MQLEPFALRIIGCGLDNDVFSILSARFTVLLKRYCGLETGHLDSFYGFSDSLCAGDRSHLEGPRAYPGASCVQNRRPFFEHVAVLE